ncbi:hypothetical protein BCR44DRAFT_35388 [Catenaria anguillulae PL171]|uniref:Ankyrin repeat-containing domain protein n=1 Tax=Catenaria anguillulae PL171 TaxID=765915 RepID=A0A1Y2HPY4_9FUNG|nr:hypothetical protein BCR44DRAFT_35388 [Catenaria anguillulae PL171]
MNDHASGLNANQPSMPIDLAELVLARTIHLAAVTSLWNPTLIAQPLNALPRSAAPLLTKVALMHLPHVDLDTATKLNDVHLLRFMLAWSKQPGGRPVNYKQPMYGAGNLEALDWWFDESGLCVKWDVECIAGAFDDGNVHVLDWWEAREFPHVVIGFEVDLGMAIFAATVRGHLHVMDWIWARLADSADKFWVACQHVLFVGAAARSGQLSVLEWWVQRLPNNSQSHLAEVLAVTFKEKHAHVLEWCLQHPDVVEQYSKQKEQSLCEDEMVLPFAIQGDLMNWIDTLKVVPFPKEHWPASRAACDSSNVEALEWLQRKQYLAGSRKQLMLLAANAATQESKRLATMKWINEHVPASVPSVRDSDFDNVHESHDAFSRASEKGDVQVLDWLFSEYGIDSTKIEQCFQSACNGHVLDCLFAHTSHSSSLLKRIAFRCMSQSHKSALDVLDWWKQKLAEGVFSLSEDDPRVSLHQIQVDVVEWWLLRSGDIRSQLDLHSFPYAALLNPTLHSEDERTGSRNKGLRIVQLFWDAKVPIDLAKCIHAASIGGNLAALDWFLHVAKVPIAHFIDAFTSPSHNKVNYVIGWDMDNHAQSLLWWGANIPQVFQVAVNRGPYSNPIHVHILRLMLKQDCLPWHSAAFMSCQGNVAMLKYLKENDLEGRSMVLDNCDLNAALLSASSAAQPHVLDWWKSESGMEVSCPKKIEDGRASVDYSARQWWKASGLCRGKLEWMVE